jgi:hypothetical protein
MHLGGITLDIKNNEFYKKWFKSAWTYVVGAVLLSLFQIVTLAATGEPWGISVVFANWGAWLYRAVGGSVDNWYYFSSDAAKATLNAGFLNDPGSIRNLAIISGALLAALLASQFKIKKIKSKKQLVAVSLGGLLMGYGARIGLGCNIGAFYSGIASLSLSGWVFGIFLFLGAIVGSKMLVKFFM